MLIVGLGGNNGVTQIAGLLANQKVSRDESSNVTFGDPNGLTEAPSNE